MRIMHVVCGIHIWWGLSLLFGFPLPRPFGALEPFFILPFANNITVGLTLSICGLLPLTSFYWPNRLWCIACLMVPQQLILGWGFLLGFIDVAVSHDGRSWYALGYTGILFLGHSVELRNEMIYEVVQRKRGK